jgi:hypothetical protein
VYKAGVLSPTSAPPVSLVPAGSPFAADALTAGWAEELAAAPAPTAPAAAGGSPLGGAGAPAAKRPRRGRGDGESGGGGSGGGAHSASSSAGVAHAGAAGGGGVGGGGVGEDGAGGAADIGSLLCDAGGGVRALVCGAQWVSLPAGALGAEEPSARWGHGASVVDDGRRVVLYGGEEGGGAVRGDTWCLDTAGDGSAEEGGGAWSLRVGDGDGAGGAGGAARAWHSMVAVPERGMIVAVGRVERDGGGEGGASGGAAAAAGGGGGEVDVDVFDTSIDLWYPPVGAGRPPSRRVGAGAALVRCGLLPSASAAGAQRAPEPMVVLFGGLASRGANRSVRCARGGRWFFSRPRAPPPPPPPPTHTHTHTARVYTHTARRLGSTTCTCGHSAVRLVG